ncbi:Mitochondrial beta-keto-acyl synthase [Spiromyces aspiralis]|uniref:Mitochondrial beta-keto-acyl synthase n=1 Tax=Spiromyces aspiralis TaxID=68401 RepID=A0ACC1HEQ2_9FUNG|nr:Mitochondrial beta-keto-acyl synthase [Spiromyces aspiralis]
MVLSTLRLASRAAINPQQQAQPSRRVVVTGLGVVSPLGVGVALAWARLTRGESGIRSLKDMLPGQFDDMPSNIAGIVPRGSAAEGGFDPAEWIDKGSLGRMATFTQYAICAAKQALDDAGWPSSNVSKDELMRTVAHHFHWATRNNSDDNDDDDDVHAIMEYARTRNQGPNHAVSTACTTGAHSIGDAMRFIQYGDADVMVAGASEAPLQPLSLAGFCRIKALATGFNDKPQEASRPFDKGRAGFVIGEGSGDASHITAPSVDGLGAQLAMERAIRNAGVSPDQIDYINAHATSTPLGDAVECAAISNVFANSDGRQVAVSSTKGATGHLLGAAGSLEAIFTILTIYHVS